MKKRLLSVMLSFVLLLSAIILPILFNYSNAFDEFAENYVKSNIKININRIIIEKINLSNIQFNEIAVVNRASDGRILSISINSIALNTIMYEIEAEIMNRLRSNSIIAEMPLGNLFGLKILSGKGPLIGVSVLPIITSSHEPKSELISSGINQTLHRISAKIETHVVCTAPFHETTCNISNSLIISEILIVGEIPEIIFSPVGRI